MFLTRPPEARRTAIDFEQFFMAHHARLVACGLALSGDVERARDAAQEAMARAYRHWDRVRTMDRPEAWVRRVVVNLLVDEGRRDARRNRQPLVVERHDDRRPSDSPLLAAVRNLPPRQRTAVVLHYLDDLPVDAVGQAMGVAVGTVKALLHQARAGLALELSEEMS